MLTGERKHGNAETFVGAKGERFPRSTKRTERPTILFYGFVSLAVTKPKVHISRIPQCGSSLRQNGKRSEDRQPLKNFDFFEQLEDEFSLVKNLINCCFGDIFSYKNVCVKFVIRLLLNRSFLLYLFQGHPQGGEVRRAFAFL